ncbi:protein PTST, chloroplastic isoform X1 [Nicotiana tabacum]|uniref:Protein PTST, chloroplastic isoform X1 n=2 Tax=Nicotiana tabacum TaxID=4097 RepID=A0AC58U8W8_TOBAC|nr:PREDICTED: protein PTST, chloroplastic-like [Nicotiana tabacum]
MECNLLINSVGSTNLPRFMVENINVRGNMASYNTRIGFHRMHKSFLVPTWKYNIPGTSWKIFCAPENLEQQFSVVASKKRAEVGESDPEASPEKIPAKTLSSDELKLLLADAERLKILKKLSEANQYNRLLKRELQDKEDVLVNFKSELAVVELEIQALVRLAEEIAKSDIPVGSRKIKGRYIQSHLFSRLGAIQEKLTAQIKDVEVAQSKEVPLSWVGVAEVFLGLLHVTVLFKSVQVMGSFDGWSQGEHLSPEYTGSYMHFSTTLFLRPGRYEIKFLVDGEWHLSPELPITGEGLTENNLLIVE